MENNEIRDGLEKQLAAAGGVIVKCYKIHMGGETSRAELTKAELEVVLRGLPPLSWTRSPREGRDSLL